ncbi:RNA polymerase sigma factor [Mesorhizobium sp. M00.F.Ca.ET.216.01.1.1]|uniref:RNA polymerase sigma factor n=1 Tax=Mesorhizobium sp. M00.F.Ca.ET.216.01.1.1 TaxID=2500528 RepID=UPI000FDA74E0|nr:RNA polymerase sigma factor [Mesorhizobium sp. M00.F.Ca.ET.216.01.1.1]TGQ35650.1 RNA polymerase sigma factor [Mesorhizobium sp. M00.F.Ca.ET.216.01.1.1]
MENRYVLTNAARQGDRHALERLLAISQPDIRRYAQSQCTGAGDADDAVQETLWLVYQRIGALRTVTSFSAWVFAIVRRECHRMWRRMNGQTELPPDDPPSFVYRPDPELRQDLIAAIHSLPDKYRDVIVLRDIQEFSIGEISVELRLTREAVKSRIHRARLMIREYLED